MRASLDDFSAEEQALLDTRAADMAGLESLMRNTLLLGSLAAATMAAVLAVIITRSIQSPLRRVLRAVDELRAGDGDLTYRLPSLSAEFGVLAASLNGFIGKLHDVVGRVRASTDSIAPASLRDRVYRYQRPRRHLRHVVELVSATTVIPSK